MQKKTNLRGSEKAAEVKETEAKRPKRKVSSAILVALCNGKVQECRYFKQVNRMTDNPVCRFSKAINDIATCESRLAVLNMINQARKHLKGGM